MDTRDSHGMKDLTESLAFLGNTMLAPMSQTSDVGLDSGFWESFPDFESQRVKDEIDRCAEFARIASGGEGLGEDAVREISVEYTCLFVGPPKPAAPPWETFYRVKGAHSGFGKATFEMRKLLGQAGLEVSNANNQYADHVGIELLYLSVLCERALEDGGASWRRCRQFACDRLLTWTGMLRERVEKAAPGGYYAHVLALVEAVLSEAFRIPEL